MRTASSSLITSVAMSLTATERTRSRSCATARRTRSRRGCALRARRSSACLSVASSGSVLPVIAALLHGHAQRGFDVGQHVLVARARQRLQQLLELRALQRVLGHARLEQRHLGRGIARHVLRLRGQHARLGRPAWRCLAGGAPVPARAIARAGRSATPSTTRPRRNSTASSDSHQAAPPAPHAPVELPAAWDRSPQAAAAASTTRLVHGAAITVAGQVRASIVSSASTRPRRRRAWARTDHTEPKPAARTLAAMRGWVASARPDDQSDTGASWRRCSTACELREQPAVCAPAQPCAAASKALLRCAQATAACAGRPARTRPRRRARASDRPASRGHRRRARPGPRRRATIAAASRRHSASESNCVAIGRRLDDRRVRHALRTQRLRRARARWTAAQVPAGQRGGWRPQRKEAGHRSSGSRTPRGACVASDVHAAAAVGSRSGTICSNGNACAATPRSRSDTTHSSACGCGRVTSSCIASARRAGKRRRPARADAPRPARRARSAAAASARTALHLRAQQASVGASAWPSAARSTSVSPCQLACAASGTLQLPPSARETARSACTASQVGRCVSVRQASSQQAAVVARAPRCRARPGRRRAASARARRRARMRSRQAQTLQPGGGQHDGVVVAFVELAQPRVEVAAQRLDAAGRAAGRAAAPRGAGSRCRRTRPAAAAASVA